MYSVSSAFNTACKSSNRQIKTRATFNGSAVIDGANIIDFTVRELLDGDSGVTMGGTCACELQMNVLVTESILPLTNGTVIPEVGLVVGNSIEYVPLGKFYITGVKTTNGYKTAAITAYDMMPRLDETYTPGVALPNTCAQVVADIASQYSFTVSGTPDYPSGSLITSIECTTREMLGYIAGLLGANAHFDRTGKLDFRWYPGDVPPMISVDQIAQGGVERLTEDDIQIGSVVTGTSDSPISVGSGTAINFANPFITQNIAQNACRRAGNTVFIPMKVRWRGNPAVEVGDRLLLLYDYSNVDYVNIMAQEIKVSGGLTMTSICYGRSDAEINITLSPTERKIEAAKMLAEAALEKASALINGARGGIFRVTDNNGDGVNDGFVIMQSADPSAAGQCIVANYEGIGLSTNGGQSYNVAITPSGINATYIVTGTLDADVVNVINLNANNITAGTLDADTVSIINLSADSISGGTFSVGGYNNAEGVVKVYDASNLLCGEWDNDSVRVYGTDEDSGVATKAQIDDASLRFGRKTSSVPEFWITGTYGNAGYPTSYLHDELIIGWSGYYTDFSIRDNNGVSRLAIYAGGNTAIKNANDQNVLELNNGSYSILRYGGYSGSSATDGAIIVYANTITFVCAGSAYTALHTGNIGTYAASPTHTHTPASIGAAAASHTHTMSDLPLKMAHGSVTVPYTGSQATINYSSAGFTSAPSITTSFAKTGANVSGDYGAIKVYFKTSTTASLYLGGTAGSNGLSSTTSMTVDWIAVGT